jgi:hypothetical protein
MLRWFLRLQVAAAWFSCSPPDLNFLDHFIFKYMHSKNCHRATAHLRLSNLLLLLLLLLLWMPRPNWKGRSAIGSIIIIIIMGKVGCSDSVWKWTKIAPYRHTVPPPYGVFTPEQKHSPYRASVKTLWLTRYSALTLQQKTSSLASTLLSFETSGGHSPNITVTSRKIWIFIITTVWTSNISWWWWWW